MRKLIFVGLILTGCAHTRIESFKEGKMQVCNVKHADLDDLKLAASKAGCAEPKFIEAVTMRDGTVIKKGLFRGTHEMKAQFCAVYECGQSLSQVK